MSTPPPEQPEFGPVRRVVQWIMRLLVILGAACWLCIYPVLMVAAGLAVMVLVPQGNELLEWTADYFDGRVQLYITILIWAFAAWYSARVLLSQCFGDPFGSDELEADEPVARFVRKWLPRFLGGTIFIALSYHLQFELNEPKMAITIFILGVLFWGFVIYRRKLQQWWRVKRGKEHDTEIRPASHLVPKLSRATFFILSIWLGTALGLFLAFLLSEVELPRALGAVPIILLAFTGWTVFGAFVLVLLPKYFKLASLALLPLLVFVIASPRDNHTLRSMPAEGGNHLGEKGQAANDPRAVQGAFERWLQENPAFQAAREQARTSSEPVKFPVYIAAAEGGGLRAAYWAASVLGELQAATEGRFSQHLFAISGVSGGSLGGASFVAELVAAQPCTGAPNNHDRIRACTSHYLNADFLSPVVAYLLFPDLMQRFFPFWTFRAWDRANAMESAWENSWRDMHPEGGQGAFAGRFDAVVKQTPDKYPAPYLFLNATKVETGQRVLVAPLPINPDEFPEVVDLFDGALSGRTITLSSAVHLSARFTYVSPAARVCKGPREDCAHEDVWGRVVDGGYHENSGALTAMDILRVINRAQLDAALGDPTLAGKLLLEPRVVLVTNDPGSARLCESFSTKPDAAALAALEQKQKTQQTEAERVPHQPRYWLSEIMSPLDALLNTRVARGTHARRTVADAAAAGTKTLKEDCEDKDRGRTNTLEFAMPYGKSPALGWFLVSESQELMHNALCLGEHKAALLATRERLGIAGEYQCRRQPVKLEGNAAEVKGERRAPRAVTVPVK
jgi:hypothetical protein